MPRQLLKLLFVWLLPLLLTADHVHWLGNYDTAHQKALKEKKPLLVLLVKKDAAHASGIIRKTFMDQPYVNRINETMVPVIVTYDGSQSYPIEMYYTTVFPTLFFVDSQRELFLQPPLYGEEITPENLKNIVGYVDTHHE